MKFELYLAFRYLRAKRKQTMVSVISAISVLGIAAGVMALVIALALSTGIREDIQAKILGTTAAVNLMRSDGSSLEDYDKLLARIGPVPHVTGSAPAIFGPYLTLLIHENRDQEFQIKGVIPSREKDVSDFFSHIVSGDPHSIDGGGPADSGNRTPPDAIMIGKEMAQELGVSPGDIVEIMYVKRQLTPLGMNLGLKTMRVRLGAIFETGLYDIDAHWAYTNIDTARQLFKLPAGSAMVLQFQTDDLEEVKAIAGEIRERAGGEYTTSTWIDDNRSLFSALKLEKLALFLTIGLIVLVASLNIVTSLVMMVMDKQGDISILAAMGATPGTIQKAFMLQGLTIGVVGTVIGDILGVGICRILDHYRLIPLEVEVYNIPFIPFHVHTWDVLLVSATAIFISYLATIYPSRRAAGLDPVEVLRYE
jgi:lipoprotein-releasing system permease protein